MMLRFFVLLTFALLGSRAGAAALMEGPSLAAVEGGVEIRWRTDVVTGSRVQYGRAVTAMSQRGDGETSTNHLVVLRGLVPGAKYFYTVGTARVPLATNVLTAPGGLANTPPAVTNRAAIAPHQSVAEKPRPAPPTRQTWGSMASLPDHFARHGRDFKAKDADDYARQAWEFLARANAEGLPAKVDADRVLRVFEPRTRNFAAYNRDGTAKTYFRPQSSGYFERQPGETVNLKKNPWPLPR